MRRWKAAPAAASTGRLQRVSVDAPVRYRCAGGAEWFEGRTENISRSGLLMRTQQFVPVRSVVEILFILPPELGGRPDETTICTGWIVRAEAYGDERGTAVAARFTGTRAAIADYDDPRRI